ncbi:MAG: 50S ribosomal protein L17 [Planctomycetes bacterium]|nr:50S ribosomal protein L17 [Planctomycetota bacterium]
MRHKKLGRKLGIRADHRKAQRMNMLTALITHGRVVTTLAKAKEYRRHADKIIHLAKVRTLARMRRAASQLGNKRSIVKRLFDVVAPQFVERPGGYTRILKLAKPRVGDAAPRAILELVGESERRAKAAEEARALEAEKATKGKKSKKAKGEEAGAEPAKS